MPSRRDFVLPPEADRAAAALATLLADTSQGLLVVLGTGHQRSFEILSQRVNDLNIDIVAVWATDPSAIRPQLEALPLAAGVALGANSVVVAIDRGRTIGIVLGENSSTDSLDLLEAIQVAAA